MKRKISLQDVAIIGIIIGIILVAVWVLTRHDKYDLPMMIIVEGQIYQYQTEGVSITEEPDGQIKTVIKSSEAPYENDMANFGEEGMDYWIREDGVLYVRHNEKTHKFKLRSLMYRTDTVKAVLSAMFDCPNKDLYPYAEESELEAMSSDQAEESWENAAKKERENWEKAVGRYFTEQAWENFLDSGTHTLFHDQARWHNCELNLKSATIGSRRDDRQEYNFKVVLSSQQKIETVCEASCEIIFEEETGRIQKLYFNTQDLLETIRAYGKDEGQTQVVCIMYEPSTFDEVLQKSDYIFKAICTANDEENANKVDSFSVDEVLVGEVEEESIVTKHVAYDNYTLGETYVLFSERSSSWWKTYYIPAWEIHLSAEGEILSYSESIEDFPEQVTNYDELVEYIHGKNGE